MQDEMRQEVEKIQNQERNQNEKPIRDRQFRDAEKLQLYENINDWALGPPRIGLRYDNANKCYGG